MPRNPEKNVYITIAFARTSPTLEHLQDEATDMGITVADLIKVLLADWTATRNGRDSRPRFQQEEPTAQQSVVQEDINLPQVVEDDASRRASAAASAASYWDD